MCVGAVNTCEPAAHFTAAGGKRAKMTDTAIEEDAPVSADPRFTRVAYTVSYSHLTLPTKRIV